MLGLVFEPMRDVLDETLLGQWLAEERFQFRTERSAVDERCLLCGHPADGLLLNELALQRVEWRQRIVFRLQGAHFRSDANSSPMKSSKCGAIAIISSDCCLRASALGFLRASKSCRN